jgi:tRNA (guanosine-2'-O-)-methyltransferase
MRRTTAGVLGVQGLADTGAARADAYDPETVVRVLEPLVTEARRTRLKEVISQRLTSVSVVLDRPYDPHNGAAVLRSCEAFGLERLHVVERDGTPFAVARSVARSAEKWIDVTCHRSAHACIAWAQAAAMPLVATHPLGELVPEDLANMPRVALVLGNEREGIRTELARACTHRVRVPMRGFVESLNVSVTAAVLLHAVTRNRQGDLDPAVKRRLYARGLYFSIDRADDILAADEHDGEKPAGCQGSQGRILPRI